MNAVINQSHPPVSAPHIPVAIIGAGACGLVAAITLRDAGVDCVLLQRKYPLQLFSPAAGRVSKHRRLKTN